MEKRHEKLWLAPVSIFILLSAVYYYSGLFPYGENTMAWGDMTQQVIPLLLELKQVLLSSDGLAFTHLTAGGMNFIGIILFFMASPFSLFVLVIPDSQLILWINVFVMGKLILCGFCAQWMFTKKFPNLQGIFAALLGFSYAMSGYALLFFQNIVWLDFMTLFPLLLIALDRLNEQKKPIPFIIVFSGMLIVNLYLSYMLILFLILFCAGYLFFCSEKENKDRWTTAFLLGISVLISALLTAPAWLSFLYEYVKSARGVDLLTSLSGGKFFADIRTTFCILLPCPLMIAACIFPAPEYRTKKKLYLWMFLLLSVPLLIDPINRMWHTGSYQAFPARYGYITVMMGLILSAMTLSYYSHHSPQYNRKRFLYLCWGFVAAYLLVIIGVLVFDRQELSKYVRSLWVSDQQFAGILLVFVTGFICTFLALFCWQNRWVTKRIVAALLCVITLAGGFFYGEVFMGKASRSADSWQLAVDLGGKIDDIQYSRVKMERKDFDINLLGGMGYNNLGHYTSLTAEEYLYGMKKLGYSCYWMETSPVGGTILTDALLCNRYIIERKGSGEEGDILYINDKYQIRELPLSMSLGVVTQKDLPELLSDGTRAEIQQQLFESIFNSEEQFVSVYEPTGTQNLSLEQTSGHYRLKKGAGSDISSLTWDIEVEGEQALYFDCFDALSTNLTEPINGAFSVVVNGEEKAEGYPSKSQNGLLYLGTFENQTVHIQVTLNKDIEAKSFGVYGMDVSLLEAQIDTQRTADLIVQGGTIEGTCEAQEGEWLFLAIPYDEGFSAKVNGEETQVYRVLDTFMAVKLEAGENVIQIEYHVPGLGIGMILFAVGILGIILLLVFRRKTPSDLIGQIAAAILGGLAGFILLIIYIIPVILWVKAHI